MWNGRRYTSRGVENWSNCGKCVCECGLLFGIHVRRVGSGWRRPQHAASNSKKTRKSKLKWNQQWMDGWRKRRKTCTIQEIVLCCLFLESSPSCNPLLLLLSKSCLLLIYSSLWNVNPLREFLPCPCYKIVIIQFFVTHSWLFLTAICSNSLYFPPLPHRSKARAQVNILLPPARQPSSCKLRQLCQRWRKEFLWTKLICCSRKTLPQLFFFFNHSSFSVHSSLVQENKSRAKGLESTWKTSEALDNIQFFLLLLL